MKRYHFYFGVFISILFLFAGCYTQLNLIDKSERYDSYYYEGDTGDSVYVEDYYADDYYYDSYYYDPYCNFNLGWNSWWLSPRWGWYVGYWYNPWRYYYSPYSYWWYNDYYYPYYWYGAGYGYAYHSNYGRRSFNRRSPYRRSNDRTAVRTPDQRILTRSRIPVTSGSKTVINSRRAASPSIRNDGSGYRHRPTVRKSPRQRVIRRNSSERQPTYSGRSTRSSSGSYRGRSSSGSSRSSSSGRSRSSSSSSSGRSRR